MRLVMKILQAGAGLMVVLLLASAASWAQAQESQSLGDIARKQREKKAQQGQKESKTLTNEDLPHSGGISTGGSASGAASSSASTAGTSESASPEGEKKAAAPGQEESPAEAAEKLAEAKKELESLQHDEGSFERGIPRLEEKAANEHDESLRQLYANAVNRARQNLEDTKKKRAEAEKKVAEMEAAAKAAQQNQPAPAPQEQPAETPPQ